MDDIDKKILYELQIDASRSITQLAKHLNMPRTTINNRMRKLKKDGAIEKIIAVVNPEKLGYHLTVFLHIIFNIQKTSDRDKILANLQKMPGVEEIHTLAGRFDIMVKLRVEHVKQLSQMIFNARYGLMDLGTIQKTESMIVMETCKEHGVLI